MNGRWVRERKGLPPLPFQTRPCLSTRQKGKGKKGYRKEKIRASRPWAACAPTVIPNHPINGQVFRPFRTERARAWAGASEPHSPCCCCFVRSSRALFVYRTTAKAYRRLTPPLCFHPYVYSRYCCPSLPTPVNNCRPGEFFCYSPLAASQPVSQSVLLLIETVLTVRLLCVCFSCGSDLFSSRRRQRRVAEDRHELAQKNRADNSWLLEEPRPRCWLLVCPRRFHPSTRQTTFNRNLVKLFLSLLSIPSHHYWQLLLLCTFYRPSRLSHFPLLPKPLITTITLCVISS